MTSVVELTSSEAGVRTVMLNRPDRLNAIDMDMLVALESALRAALDDEDVRAIVLCGAGRAFCAGDDVTAQAQICAGGEVALRAQLALLQRISEYLTLGEKPTIAAVRGWAVGAGFSWSLNCDFALWSEGAGGFLPEVTFGTFVTGGATFLLPQIVGRQRAHEMLLRGYRIRSTEALACGLARSVEPEDQLLGAARALAAELSALPPTAVRTMKRVLAGGWEAAFRHALAAEIEACVATTLEPATLARMRAALDKGR